MNNLFLKNFYFKTAFLCVCVYVFLCQDLKLLHSV